jgi:predicted lipoprotein with Yx(FWY)xxD motif
MLVAAACGSSSNDTSSGTTTTAGQATTTTTAAETTTTAGSSSGSSATVSVAQTSAKGAVLAGPDGRTLYIFDKDTPTTSACMGGCASVWPALTATGTPSAGDGVDDSKLSTANGQVANQVMYNGHFLYLFSGDTAAGQTNGTSIPNWHAVTADGNAAP